MFNRDDSTSKRAMKGVRNTAEIDHDSYLNALYSNIPKYANEVRLNFVKKYGTMALLETRKKALNTTFTKLQVQDDLVTVLPLSKNKEFV